MDWYGLILGILVLVVVGAGLGGCGSPYPRKFLQHPGHRQQAILSINARDIPVVQATVMLTTVAIAVANLLTDITYGILDPRIQTT